MRPGAVRDGGADGIFGHLHRAGRRRVPVPARPADHRQGRLRDRAGALAGPTGAGPPLPAPGASGGRTSPRVLGAPTVASSRPVLNAGIFLRAAAPTASSAAHTRLAVICTSATRPAADGCRGRGDGIAHGPVVGAARRAAARARPDGPRRPGRARGDCRGVDPARRDERGDLPARRRRRHLRGLHRGPPCRPTSASAASPPPASSTGDGDRHGPLHAAAATATATADDRPPTTAAADDGHRADAPPATEAPTTTGAPTTTPADDDDDRRRPRPTPATTTTTATAETTTTTTGV